MNSREFAIDVVQRLQAASFTALWAGGCVRDQAVGKTPKDYDVATSATPDQVRELFGRKRTLAIGASFGVITVLGPKSADPIEVATFRRDTGYSDGRRPDAIEFTDAREDAIRRDFTINGMFYDPIADQVIDYVGGLEDLERKVIQAIGNPHERIEEDKLRMLRAIRFAATFDFSLEAETMKAVQQRANEINIVSAERIGAELRRMLKSPNRAVAVKLLRESKLLDYVLKGSENLPANQFEPMLQSLSRLEGDSFACATSILVLPFGDLKIVEQLVDDWKISNEEKKVLAWILKHHDTFRQASKMAWSKLQPLLIQPESRSLLEVMAARGRCSKEVDYCRERLQWPAEKLNPNPFLDGGQLKELGVLPGPLFGKILKELRGKQLDGEITNVDAAIEFARNAAS
jgi:tRNA nucleotidyltransferase/poly(A) polymerase